MERIAFNTWDAFNRAYLRVITRYGDKQIHGQIYLPAHFTFKTWEEFHEAVREIKKLGEEISDNLHSVRGWTRFRNESLANKIKIGFPDSNENDALPSIYGVIWVEITDPWIKRW